MIVVLYYAFPTKASLGFWSASLFLVSFNSNVMQTAEMLEVLVSSEDGQQSNHYIAVFHPISRE